MRQAKRRLISYGAVALAAVVASAVGKIAGLDPTLSYLLAAAVLSSGVVALLSWSEPVRLRARAPRTPEPSPRPATDRSSRSRDHLDGWIVAPVQLGLAGASTSTADPALEPVAWLPAADAPRRVSLRAHGADLRVGAHAADDARIAAVRFPAFGTVYVPLSPEGGARYGEVVVPDLARELVEQRVAVSWFASVAELPADDAEWIARSVQWGGAAVRAAWREAAARLSAGDPVASAVMDALGDDER